MSAFNEIKKVLEAWGEDTAIDLREQLIKELSKHGKNVQEPKLRIDPVILVDSSGIKLQIQMDDYWQYIERGRKAGSKQPPSNALGKKWQNLHNIDARKILIDIRLKKGLKAPKKSLNYDQSAKQLSFILARSIGKKGIKAKPFIKPVISDRRLESLKDQIRVILKKDFEITVIT